METKDTDIQQKNFFNAEMPKWYKIISWIIYTICSVGILIIFIISTIFNTVYSTSSVLIIIGLTVIAMLPSIPKAFIEQRNRIRGIRDGSFQKHLDESKK